MATRDSFVFYRSFYEALKELPPENRCKLYDVIMAYEFENEKVELSGVEKAIFILICPQLDVNNKRYENGCKGAVYGKLGGRPKKQETPTKPQTEMIQTANVNDNLNVNVFKKRLKKEKISCEDIGDWETLFRYWEENKKGGGYKNAESRKRQLEKLKELTGNDFNYAKQAILHCIDNKYQGFCNGSGLFYQAKRQTSQELPPETVSAISKYWVDE